MCIIYKNTNWLHVMKYISQDVTTKHSHIKLYSQLQITRKQEASFLPPPLQSNSRRSPVSQGIKSSKNKTGKYHFRSAAFSHKETWKNCTHFISHKETMTSSWAWETCFKYFKDFLHSSCQYILYWLSGKFSYIHTHTTPHCLLWLQAI